MSEIYVASSAGVPVIAAYTTSRLPNNIIQYYFVDGDLSLLTNVTYTWTDGELVEFVMTYDGTLYTYTVTKIKLA